MHLLKLSSGQGGLRPAYFLEIKLQLKNGESLIIERISSSKSFHPPEKDIVDELKAKSKIFGSFIAEKLKIQYFYEKGIKRSD